MPKLTSYTTEMGFAARELSQARARPLTSSVRFQVLILLLVALISLSILPAIGMSTSVSSWRALTAPQSLLSFFFAMLASVCGLLLIRALSKHPGLTKAPYVLPSLLVVYGLVIFLMFFFRIDYSRYVIGVSFLSSFTWLQAIFYIQDRRDNFTLATIPSESATATTTIKGARWTILQSPKDPLVGVAGVVVDLRSELSPSWERFIAQCALAGVPVYDLKAIAETLTGQVDVTHLSETVYGSLLPSSAYLRIKRSVDFVAALVLLPAFLFVIALAAIAIKLESDGPVFFKQQRMGFRAHSFNIFKLRSMTNEPADGNSFTVENDPRITNVGKFIRKYRIDEFPQIINIIKGEMSWIGPRPEAVALSEWYAQDIPFYIYRHAVRPGISGWAQVNQGNVAEIDAASLKLRYDFYYIKYFSPFLDILIVLRTFHTMLTGFGSK
jgi:lipopolysaccharide/colanic/teichoic acid biosynthesis glycosyltransferase